MNFIYINPDEMAARCLGCYGHPLVKTPHIDQLAAQGTRFSQCHVQHTVCTPSRCSFLTGWYPHVRGHRTLWHTLRPEDPNTFRYLKEAGYQVHWWGKNDALCPQSAASSTTAIYAGFPGHKAEHCYKSDEVGRKSFLYGPAQGQPSETYMTDDAIAFLKARKPDDDPFMMFHAWVLPHCPYTVPEPWYSMYDPDDVPPLHPVVLKNKPMFYRLIREYRDLQNTTPDDWMLRKIMAVYLGMISYVDDQVGRLIKALDDTGLRDQTTIVFFSDHGDWPGDYGLVEKWSSGLDDCLTHVPLIISAPDTHTSTPMARGHTVNEPVELFDIMPTTLELAEVPIKHSHFARSLMPQLQGQAGDPQRAVFTEGGYDAFEPHCLEGKPIDGVCRNASHIYYPKGRLQQDHPESVCRAVSIRTATHRLVRRSRDINELYDLQSDSLELNNVYDHPDYQDIQHHLEQRMLDWYLTTSDVTPWDTNPRQFLPDQVVDRSDLYPPRS